MPEQLDLCYDPFDDIFYVETLNPRRSQGRENDNTHLGQLLISIEPMGIQKITVGWIA